MFVVALALENWSPLCAQVGAEVKERSLRQYAIVCLYDDLLGAQVNVLIRRIGADASICVHTTIWHMCGYLRCHYKLASVHGHMY